MSKKKKPLTSEEELEQLASDIGVPVYGNVPLPEEFDGLYFDHQIALNKNIPTETEKSCILAEEIGHALYTTGNIIDQSKVENRKQEMKARGFSYQMKVPIAGIIMAAQRGCHTRFEIAECLGVPEDFLDEAIKFYRRKFGLYFVYDKHHIVYFEPLGVLIISNWQDKEGE